MDNKNMLKASKTRYWLIGSGIALIALFVLLRLVPARATKATTETTGIVTAVNVAETVEASGSLEGQPSASLTWSASGVVEKVNVKAGDKVSAGDVLMQLKSTGIDANIISAQSDLVTAQQDLEDVFYSSDTKLAQAAVLELAEDA